MLRVAGRNCASLVGGLLAIAAFAGAAPPDDWASQLLAEFPAGDRRAIDDGDVVTRTLKTLSKSEVASLSAMRVAVPVTFLLECYRDIEWLQRGDNLLEIGLFSAPPQPDDLAALHVSADDVAPLARCHAGDCKVKLSADAIDRFREDVDWRSPDALAQAERLTRRLLLERVSAYQREGDPGLAAYHDNDLPLGLGSEFQAVLHNTPELDRLEPDLRAYLAGYPSPAPHGVNEFFYWSKVQFGLKPVITATHVVLYDRVADGRRRVIIAAKQLYASHYLIASLGLTFIDADLDEAEHGGYTVVYLNRTRSDNLGGVFGGLKRSIANNGSRRGVDHNMARTRSRLLARYAEARREAPAAAGLAEVHAGWSGELARACTPAPPDAVALSATTSLP